MRRQPKTGLNDRRRHSTALRKVEPEPCGAERTASSSSVELLAPAFGQTLPSLANVPTNYDYEENSGTLLSLCRALAEREIGIGNIWQQAGKQPLEFAVAAIRSSIEQKCGDLLNRNVDYRLAIEDTVDGYGRPALKEGVLVLTVECHGCGYLRIGPALNALEREAAGLGAAFYHLLRLSLYRSMRIYDHTDAEEYNDNLHDWADQDDEGNQRAYEFPDVEASISPFVRNRDGLELHHCRALLRRHSDGICGAWIKRVLKLHALTRLHVKCAREWFDDAWDSSPLPALLISFQDQDGIVACFDAESRSMYEASHEPTLCVVFSPSISKEADEALRFLRRFLAINIVLFTLVEALNQHKEEVLHADADRDREQPELLAA